MCLRQTGPDDVHGVRVQRGGRGRLPHHRIPARAADRHHHQQLCAVQRAVPTTIISAKNRFLDEADESNNIIIVPVTLERGNNFGQALKDYRKIHGLKQTELAAKLGIPHPTLRAWEQGKAKPRYKLMKKIKEELNLK